MSSYANSSSNPTAITAGKDRLILDNLIRRELKVGDPSDPHQVAEALLERYRGDPRAQAIQQESRGLPFLQAVAPVATALAQSSAACGAEWQQATDDIESDLRSLMGDAILKDVKPELNGWAQAIRNALAEGYNAAKFALDPRSRDKGFAMRRQLNDYARLARLVGAHTPSLVANFRKFAQSLDEAANLLLVIMGEALANVGFGGGRYLPQVAYADLQTRRDAAIYALRNLVGSTQMAYGPEDWPRGLDAYRQLTELLEAQGQNDLRSLLVETELARTMDELVQRSGDNTSAGLRAVGSTALLALERFRRLVRVARRGISPESPALYAFLEALQLFASAFDSAGGFRLMKIARPPILFYGLYGNTGMDDADRRLVDLITRRGMLAETLDCLAESCCTNNRSCLVLLDKVLYDLDRAIDLYALGFANFGATERRASAYGFVIDAVIRIASACRTSAATALDQKVIDRLEELAGSVLRPTIDIATDEGMRSAVRRIRDLAERIIAALNIAGRPDSDKVVDGLAALPTGSTGSTDAVALTRLYAAIVRTDARLREIDVLVEGDAEVEAYVGVIEQELCLQREMESRWDILVHSMVANCGTIDVSLGHLREVVDTATQAVIGDICRDEAPIDLPPALETSFDTLVDSVERTGLGRPNRARALQKRG